MVLCAFLRSCAQLVHHLLVGLRDEIDEFDLGLHTAVGVECLLHGPGVLCDESRAARFESLDDGLLIGRRVRLAKRLQEHLRRRL